MRCMMKPSRLNEGTVLRGGCQVGNIDTRVGIGYLWGNGRRNAAGNTSVVNTPRRGAFMNTLLTYFVASVTATIGGLMFYMAVENLHPPSDTESRRKEVATCILLSAVFTPLGAWMISVVVRLKKLPPLP